MKDYSKLRPFDLEKFKAGERALFFGGACPEVEIRTYVAGPDSNDNICIRDASGRLQVVRNCADLYRLAPLAWVRKSADEEVLWPVYKGDVLYNKEFPGVYSSEFKVDSVRSNAIRGNAIYCDRGTWLPPECLTFTPATKVKREGWINIYFQKYGGGIIYASKREAEEAALGSNAVQLHIEWEESAEMTRHSRDRGQSGMGIE